MRTVRVWKCTTPGCKKFIPGFRQIDTIYKTGEEWLKYCTNKACDPLTYHRLIEVETHFSDQDIKAAHRMGKTFDEVFGEKEDR